MPKSFNQLSFRGAVAAEVIGILDAYRIGVIDYPSFFFQPIFVIGLLCLSTRHLDPPMPSHDPIADLLTKQVSDSRAFAYSLALMKVT